MLVLLLSLLNGHDLAEMSEFLYRTFGIVPNRPDLELLFLRVMPLTSINSKVFLQGLVPAVDGWHLPEGSAIDEVSKCRRKMICQVSATRDILDGSVDFGNNSSGVDSGDATDRPKSDCFLFHSYQHTKEFVLTFGRPRFGRASSADWRNEGTYCQVLSRISAMPTGAGLFAGLQKVSALLHTSGILTKDRGISGIHSSTAFARLQYHGKHSTTFNEIPTGRFSYEPHLKELIVHMTNDETYSISPADHEQISTLVQGSYSITKCEDNSICDLEITESVLNGPTAFILFYSSLCILE